jgi:hypothetical protein
MMDIKQQWQDAVAEFGDRAFEWFTGVTCNDDVVYYISVGDNVELKPLPELFEHGVSVYGFEAEKQMWEWLCGDDWIPIPELSCQNEILCCMDQYKHRRKTSASLPLDLERAKAGDVVELDVGDRCIIKFLGESKSHKGLLAVMNSQGVHHVSKDVLLMKYPQKLENQK